MRRDPRAYLWDALRAAGLLAQFGDGRTFADYEGDPMLRSAVERQFEIIGEAPSWPIRTRDAAALGDEFAGQGSGQGCGRSWLRG